MSSTQRGFIDSLVSAARENPFAAALIGGGALWLLLGDEKLRSAATSAAAAVSPIIDTATHSVRVAASGIQRTAAPPTAPEMDHEGSFDAVEPLLGAASTASDAVSGVAEEIKDRVQGGAAYAREALAKLPSGKETLTQAHSSLSELLERQPLALGVVGLAIGAAIAGAFGTSRLEDGLMGEVSDAVKADLSARAGAVSERVREASDRLQAELGDTAAEAVDRAKQAGLDAAGAAREKMKSP
jgi:hypothetical protein